jgi:hypothetical protein
MISQLVIALATLGGAKQIGLLLFVSLCPRQPRQVRKVTLHHDITDIFANKLCHCKQPIKP